MNFAGWKRRTWKIVTKWLFFLQMKTKEVIKLLEANGVLQLRIKGNHRIFGKTGARRPIVVPGSLNDDLKEGTLSSILREAGLK